MDSDADELDRCSSTKMLDQSEDEEMLDKDISSKSTKSKQLVNSIPGLVYVSFLPPKMTPLHLKQIFSKYGEIGRIYLQPDSK